MKKHITYTEEELSISLKQIKRGADGIDLYVQMMKEQHEGIRENLDMSIHETLGKEVVRIKNALKTFGIDIK